MRLAVCVLVTMVSLTWAADDYYKIKTSVKVDDVLKSDRLLENFHKCLVDKGTCTADGAQLKKIIPEVIATRCGKCSPKQKQSAAKVVKFLQEKKPQLWKELMDKYDADGKLRAAAKNDPEVKKYINL